jgi:hypothetical protein
MMRSVAGHYSTSIFLAFLFLRWSCVDGFPAALQPHNALSSSLEALIETKSLEGKERADWLKEKALIEAQNQAWKTESDSLSERIHSLQDSLEQYQPKAESDSAKSADLDQVANVVSQVLATIEKRVTNLFPRLPSPLKNDLSVYIGRLDQPTGSAIRSLDTRCRNLVYLLDRIHEFDQKFTLHWETRQHPDGSEVLVQVLYLGLSRAYFVDARGEIAGTGSPSDKGWTWQFEPKWAKPVQEAIAIHDRRAAPSIVRLPASIE